MGDLRADEVLDEGAWLRYATGFSSGSRFGIAGVSNTGTSSTLGSTVRTEQAGPLTVFWLLGSDRVLL